MFKVKQRVYCLLRGWGTVVDMYSEDMIVSFDGRGGSVRLYKNGKYSYHQNQCVFPGKPIVSGYEPPPFEGKLKGGEMVLIKSRSDPEYTWYTIKVKLETESHVISTTETRFAKVDYIFYRVDKEPVY